MLEERKIRKLAAARQAPGDWIRRARMITVSWDGKSTAQIAGELECHRQTVRERLHRFNTHRLEGLGDRAGSGRQAAADQGRAQPHCGLGRHNAARASDAAIRRWAARRERRGSLVLDAGFPDRCPARRRHRRRT
ncbi:helix-turn-helix domain-containing protein [Nocardia tengchongensis]|uniref:helix-turn-helix domain-containing protein n=1 Tax=Nocardia tengchongensis TaxID=2055889 RepID=UPI003612DA33